MAKKKKANTTKSSPDPSPVPLKSSPRKRRNIPLAPSRDTIAYKLESAFLALGHVPDSNPPTLLTLDIVRSVPQITPIIKSAFRRGMRDAIEYIRMSNSPVARKFLKLYDDQPPVNRKVLPIEAYCIVLKIQPVTLLGIITEACFSSRDDVSTLIASVAKPKIVQDTIASASILGPDGFRDRQMLLQHGGFLPQNKNQTIYIRDAKLTQVNNNQQTVSIGELNKIEADLLDITSRYDESIGLKRELPPAIEPAMDVELSSSSSLSPSSSPSPFEPERPADSREVEFIDEPDTSEYTD